MQAVSILIVLSLLAACSWTASAWRLPVSARNKVFSRSSTKLSAYEECKPGGFNELISKAQGPVLVDFYANWCGPCKMMSPVFDQLSEELTGKVKFVKVNSDQNIETVERYNVPGLPYFALFHNGQMIASQAGAMRKEALQDFINRSLRAKGLSK